MVDQDGNPEIISRRDAKAGGLTQYFTGVACSAGHIAARRVINWGCMICESQHLTSRRRAKIAALPVAAKTAARTSRSDAMARGLKRYFTGIPCSRGHVADRLVGNNTCVACDLARKIGDSAVQAKLSGYYRAHRDEILTQSKAYQAANADKINAKRKAHREANKTRINAKIAEWAKANPGKRRAKERAREGRERGAEGTHTWADIEALRIKQRGRCAHPGCKALLKDGFHVDHVKPIALGGSNWPSNLQLLCPPHNQAKGARDPIDWAQQNGLLL